MTATDDSSFAGSDPSPVPVAFVHGLGGSTHTTWRQNGWLDLAADAGRPTIGIDLLGHGDAAKPHDPRAYADMAAYVLELLPDEPVDAIGFSLGARVLLQCASAAPERFRKLVVAGVGANLFSRDKDRHEAIAAAFRGDGDTTDPFIRYFADLVDDPAADAEALRALIESPSDPLTNEQLSPVTMPVLVVLGDDDFAGPADPLLHALFDATFAELTNTDHFATPRSMRFIDVALTFIDAQPF